MTIVQMPPEARFGSDAVVIVHMVEVSKVMIVMCQISAQVRSDVGVHNQRFNRLKRKRGWPPIRHARSHVVRQLAGA